jgi:hypothetical protein
VVQSSRVLGAKQGQISNQRRNQYYNPGFSDVGFSVVKGTEITGKVSFQFRAEIVDHHLPQGRTGNQPAPDRPDTHAVVEVVPPAQGGPVLNASTRCAAARG